jgi:putative two-component system response regulator
MVNFKELFQYTTKLNILYVEDDLILLEKTTSFLEELFNKVITAVDGVEGLEEYKKYKKDNNEYFDLVITDINMPKKDGLVMIKDIFNLNKHQPIIVISAHNESEKLIYLIEQGISNFLMKPIEITKLMDILLKITKNISNQKNIDLYQKQLEELNKTLDDKVQEQAEEILYTQKISIHAIADMVESYDDDTGTHVKRIELYTQLFVENLPNMNIYTKNIRELIPFASLLHDIGKLMIPKSILTKPSSLTDEEFEIIKTHAKLGGKVLEKANNEFKEKFQKDSYLQIAADIAMYHHEKYNGKGYPDGLKGEEIPLCARIVSIADVYDALRSKRVYKEGFSHEKSVAIIKEERGESFDPKLVDFFLNNHEKFDEIFKNT